MSRNDSGVYKRKNNTWGYRFKITINGKSIERRRNTDDLGKPFATKAEALKAKKAALAAAGSELIQAEQSDKVIVRKTFGEVFGEYCKKGRSDRAFTTKMKQDSLWKNHLREKFGDRYVDEVSPAEIQDYLSRLYYVDGYAYRYVESFLKQFYLIFGQAYCRNYLSIDKYNQYCVNKLTKIHMPKVF